MDVKLKTWLYDILNAINEIDSYFEDTTSGFYVFQNDLRTKRAVERNIEIIGEAMSRILHLGVDVQISNARKIVDIRNRIIHGYDNVSDEIIWSVIVSHLPLLKTEVSFLLNE